MREICVHRSTNKAIRRQFIFTCHYEFLQRPHHVMIHVIRLRIYFQLSCPLLLVYTTSGACRKLGHGLELAVTATVPGARRVLPQWNSATIPTHVHVDDTASLSCDSRLHTGRNVAIMLLLGRAEEDWRQYR